MVVASSTPEPLKNIQSVLPPVPKSLWHKTLPEESVVSFPPDENVEQLYPESTSSPLTASPPAKVLVERLVTERLVAVVVPRVAEEVATNKPPVRIDAYKLVLVAFVITREVPVADVNERFVSAAPPLTVKFETFREPKVVAPEMASEPNCALELLTTGP